LTGISEVFTVSIIRANQRIQTGFYLETLSLAFNINEKKGRKSDIAVIKETR
jgi:hypothetical protein